MTNYYDDDGNGTPLPNTTLLVCSPLALLGARRKKLCYKNPCRKAGIFLREKNQPKYQTITAQSSQEKY